MRQVFQALAVAAVGALLGFVVSFFVPARYPVSVLLEIGRVPEITAAGMERPTAIDPPATVANSIRQPGSMAEVARQVARTEPGIDAAQLSALVRDTDARVLAPADLIEVSVWSPDPQLASTWLERLTDPIIGQHDALFKATVERYRTELQVAGTRLREVDAQIRSVVDQRSSENARKELTELSFGQTLSILDLSRRFWHDRVTTLEATLDERILRRTHRKGPVSIGYERALPTRSLLVALGALLTLVAWGAWRIVRAQR